jgi:hypothetical protein
MVLPIRWYQERSGSVPVRDARGASGAAQYQRMIGQLLGHHRDVEITLASRRNSVARAELDLRAARVEPQPSSA